MIPVPAPEQPIGTLNALQTVVGAAALVLTIIAVIFGGEGSVPSWLGLIVTLGVAIIVAFSVRWYRRRPIEVGDFESYRHTVIVRWSIAADTAVIGSIMSFVGDSPWPAVVGFVCTILALALAPVSADDYLRHQVIFIEENAEVPAEKWGAADPAAEAPWETLEEGHGHGLSH